MKYQIKNIPGFPGYWIDVDGNVWSSWKTGNHKIKHGNIKKMTPRNAGNNYRKVTLCKEGNQASFYIHHLVLNAFVGPCPEGMEACHNNGDSTNNILKNLRWDTKKSNERDKVKHGTRLYGEKSPVSKLKREDVECILRLIEEGEQLREIAEKYPVRYETIRRIKKKQTWKHLFL